MTYERLLQLAEEWSSAALWDATGDLFARLRERRQWDDGDPADRLRHERLTGTLGSRLDELDVVVELVWRFAPDLLGDVPSLPLDPPFDIQTAERLAGQMRRLWGLLVARRRAAETAPTLQQIVAEVSVRADPDRPCDDVLNDILAHIREAGHPLKKTELVEAMRLDGDGGKLGHHLAWMTRNGVLTNARRRGYWPADHPLTE